MISDGFDTIENFTSLLACLDLLREVMASHGHLDHLPPAVKMRTSRETVLDSIAIN